MASSHFTTTTSQCGCGDAVLRIPLDHPRACQHTALAFEFHQDNQTQAAALAFTLCRGDRCPRLGVQTFADNPAEGGSFLGATSKSLNACIETDASEPTRFEVAALNEGENLIGLETLNPSLDGWCSGEFDAIEVHLLAGACHADPSESATTTLSKLRFVEVPTPSEPPCPHPNVIVGSASTGYRQCFPEERSHYDKQWLFHLSYGAGVGAVSSSKGVSFRQAFDGSVALGLFQDAGQGGFFSRAQKGPFVGAALNTGFGAYPTYLALEGGYARVDLQGWLVSAGPAARVLPNVGVGAEASALYYLLIFQLGARAIGIITEPREFQLQATLGVGLP
jgi:hypothetical protein